MLGLSGSLVYEMGFQRILVRRSYLCWGGWVILWGEVVFSRSGEYGVLLMGSVFSWLCVPVSWLVGEMVGVLLGCVRVWCGGIRVSSSSSEDVSSSLTSSPSFMSLSTSLSFVSLSASLLSPIQLMESSLSELSMGNRGSCWGLVSVSVVFFLVLSVLVVVVFSVSGMGLGLRRSDVSLAFCLFSLFSLFSLFILFLRSVAIPSASLSWLVWMSYIISVGVDDGFWAVGVWLSMFFSVTGHLLSQACGSSPYTLLRSMPRILSLPHPVLSSVYL